MRQKSDVELLGLVAGRDEAALRELVERHSAWLLMRLRRRTPDEGLAAEVVQDVFVAVWRRPRAYRGDGDIGAWLWGIAIRRLISRLRVKAAPSAVTTQVLSALSPAVRSAEEELLLAVEYGSVGTALAALPPELRQVLLATVVDGLSTREAAHLLGLPHGTVKSRLRIAKSRLRAHLLSVEGWA